MRELFSACGIGFVVTFNSSLTLIIGALYLLGLNLDIIDAISYALDDMELNQEEEDILN